MKTLLFMLFVTMCWSCIHNSETEIYQKKRDQVINVREKVKEIKINDILIGQTARIYLINDNLIVADHKSNEKLIHIFDRNSYKYLTSTGYRGQGPGEIANMGHIETDSTNRMFYLSDHGKQTIFSYNLDSVLANPLYFPEAKMKMNVSQFPDRYQNLNDTLSMGIIIEPIGNSDFKQLVAKWNMNTGEIIPMKYENPNIERKRINFAVSVEDSTFVECYSNHDLMTICSLNGTLKYNVYGPDWDSKKTNNHYYGKVLFCNDKIFASYAGGNKLSDEYYPTKFFIFDLNGNYLKTLEIGYRICDYCYDKENNRVPMFEIGNTS